MSRVILLQGMCYAGKSTLGKLLASKLNLVSLDSKEMFFNMYAQTENDYLSKHGRDKFIEAEKETMRQEFEPMVISLAGSAIYYTEIMKKLQDKYTIVWLNVPFEVIEHRKNAAADTRPIVFPDGIHTFEELYRQRAALYEELHDIEIRVVAEDRPDDVIKKICDALSQNK